MPDFVGIRAAIREAVDEKEIVALLRSCSASLPREIFGALPIYVQDILESGKDIDQDAKQLVTAQMRFVGPIDVAIVLQEISQTYSAAATRIARVRTSVR
jgi:hypothetical protein